MVNGNGECKEQGQQRRQRQWSTAMAMVNSNRNGACAFCKLGMKDPTFLGAGSQEREPNRGVSARRPPELRLTLGKQV
jgi:hypothetical protein